MSTSITKVASIDTIASAMEQMYSDYLVKKAADNYYATAMAKIQQAASRGYQPAKDILSAISGTLPHGGKPLSVTDSSIGLTQQEAYAISDALNKGSSKMSSPDAYPVARSNMNALETYMGNLSGNTTPAAPETGGIAEIQNVEGLTPTDSVQNAVSSTPGTLPTGTGNLADIGNTGGGQSPQAGAGPNVSPMYKKQQLMLDAIVKVAEVLADSGFELSEAVADELLNTVIEESKSQ